MGSREKERKRAHLRQPLGDHREREGGVRRYDVEGEVCGVPWQTRSRAFAGERKSAGRSLNPSPVIGLRASGARGRKLRVVAGEDPAVLRRPVVSPAATEVEVEEDERLVRRKGCWGRGQRKGIGSIGRIRSWRRLFPLSALFG
ncbi:hypothetical protein KSP40_PGU013363 [Platanthera guangdongensis]|uniref:Uncharacterized protein n=1 Tax=Platanthera guangdongensis TaxID=2320717 RepID=A0ABR2N575_9ASPA